jgi:hypothetical protein
MQTTQKIIDLVNRRTKGLVKITPLMAQEIINIVISGGETPFVKLYRYEINGWKLHRQIPTSQDTIDREIRTALKAQPVDHFYKYECFNQNGELEGNIFSTNANLFS